MIGVLIADDEALVRAGVHSILDTSPDIDVLGEAADGLEAIDRTRDLSPDLVLMDVQMPKVDGIEATRHVVSNHPSTRVLVLTTFDLDVYVYEALRAGASGFLLKAVPPEQLLAAVSTVARGDALLSPAVTQRLIERFLRRPPPGTSRPTGLDALTDREVEILRLVASGLSNTEIAASLVVSPATVKTHVSHVLTKLDLRDRIQAVVLAYESGLIEPGADAP